MKPESKTQTKLDTLESNFTEYPTSIIEINDYFDYYDKATDELEALLVGADENNSQKINKSIEELKELATHNENNKQEILNKLESLGLTLADYHDFVELADLRSEARSYDTVLYGCGCGCGGDSMDFDTLTEIDEGIEELERILNIPVGMVYKPTDED